MSAASPTGVTPDGSNQGDVMSDVYYVPSTVETTPGANTSDSTSTPSGPVSTPSGPVSVPSAPVSVPSAPSFKDDRKLVFVGAKNVVICHDISNPAKPVEVWRHEMKGSSVIHTSETYVVFSGGIVVAIFLKTMVGLDPMTGEERWSCTIKRSDMTDCMTVISTNFVVYCGSNRFIAAVSALNGQILWELVFDFSIMGPFIPTIVACGLCVFIVRGSEAVYLNAADGSVIWRTQFSGSRGAPATAAWDGANRILVGSGGYIFRYDVRDGKELERINLKGTNYFNVALAFDNNRKVFYALTNFVLFALSSSEDNKIMWKCDIPHSILNSPTHGFDIEPISGMIYVLFGSHLYCVDPFGKMVFDKKIDGHTMITSSYAIVQDIQGSSGMILAGGAGFFAGFDKDGEMICQDGLAGLGFGQTYLCTPTSSINPNSSCQEANASGNK